MWKGSVNDCVGHFNEKHGGSEFFELKNVQRFFPPWMVARDVWQMALRPDVSGIAVDTACCRLVHKYCVYKDPFPHPALHEGVIPHLLSFVDRAMVIAQLTHINILIPASGMPPGQVPAECFPGGGGGRLHRSCLVLGAFHLPLTSRCWDITCTYSGHCPRGAE